MRKRILLITSIILTLSIIVISTFNNMDNKENNIISNVEKNKQVITNNMITMMYETESGSGEYTETKDTTWPESGYIFNDTLSGCENGGELEYNSQNNTVNLLSNSSDQCYVYFDKYDGVWIDNVAATNVTGSSIILDVNATSENGSITTYYYALNDSEEYIETTSNIITINDLNKLTEYKIKIYAIDNTGSKSNIYEISVSTTDISVPVINSVSASDITTSGFTLTVNATSDVEIERYYYIIENENISGTSTINNYTFNNLKNNINYNVKVFVKDINDTYSNEYEINVETEKGLFLADYIKSLYTSQGSNGIYYHTSSLANSAGDNSYRYSGANPNNYVCFGSDAATCPSDNLYRIIGVFDNKIKLIMADYPTNSHLGTGGAYFNVYKNVYSSPRGYKGTQSLSSVGIYDWNQSGTNIWSESSLNITNLNLTFFSSFDDTWKNEITESVWYVNGYSTYDATPFEFHKAEIFGKTWIGNIGLMYVSDYGYAASPNYWTINLSNYSNNCTNNWMCMGLSEWTITANTNPLYNNSAVAFSVLVSGVVRDGFSDVSNHYYAIRPCFYLNSDVIYISGTGTQSDPFRIQ